MPSLLEPTVKLDAIAHKNVEDAHIRLNLGKICALQMCVLAITQRVFFQKADCSFSHCWYAEFVSYICLVSPSWNWETVIFRVFFLFFLLTRWYSFLALISGLFDERLQKYLICIASCIFLSISTDSEIVLFWKLIAEIHCSPHCENYLISVRLIQLDSITFSYPWILALLPIWFFIV